MSRNPFTPIFGGKPDFFFGRSSILSSFDDAMENRGSEYRTLFITGTRGYGKTALLEQLSQRCRSKKWRTIDVGPEKTLACIMRALSEFDETARTISPEVELSIMGTGGKISGGSSTKTAHYDVSDLQHLLLKACEKEKRGLLLTVDEVQKVSIDDVSAICGAFQMTSRKGFDVMLAIAGLPHSHGKVIQHEGCTYVRRALHIKLGPLTAEEVRDALIRGIDMTGNLSIDDPALESLVKASKGHPYILQLLGYYLVEQNMRNRCLPVVKLEIDEAERAIKVALETYAERAVKPIIDVLPKSEKEYLLAMSRVIDESRIARTADIAEELGKTAQQTSRQRSGLIDSGLIIPAGRGQLIFGIPYLDGYFNSQPRLDSELTDRLPWRY